MVLQFVGFAAVRVRRTSSCSHQAIHTGTSLLVRPMHGDPLSNFACGWEGSPPAVQPTRRKGLADEQREMEMCLEWCKHVDGIEIFPTAPSYLRQHVKKWQRSNHVRDHIRKAKHKLEELRAVNATTLNTFLSARNGSVCGGSNGTKSSCSCSKRDLESWTAVQSIGVHSTWRTSREYNELCWVGLRG